MTVKVTKPPARDPSVVEYLATLSKRRAYLIGAADERSRRGEKVDLEIREARALAWALSILESLYT